jgi:hypothetical protein
MGLLYKKATPAPHGPAETWLWSPSASDNFVSTSSEDKDELAGLFNLCYLLDFGEPLKEDRDADSHRLHEADSGDLNEMLDALLEEMGVELEVGQMQVEVERAMQTIGLG